MAMPNNLCIVKESKMENGMIAIEMHTPLLRVVVLPAKGADIHSIQYKKRENLELLWKAPWGVSAPGMSMLHSEGSKQRWLDAYHGGWQLMFPNAGNECHYKGVLYGFHGEASMVPWKYQVEKTGEKLRVRFCTDLTRSPFRLERVLQLESNTATLTIEEKITNLGREAMDCEWGQHIAFGEPFLSEDCSLHVPAKSIIGAVRDQLLSRLPFGQSNWPHVTSHGKIYDMSKMPPRHEHTTDFGVLCDLSEGYYELTNSKLDLSVGVAWDLRVMPYVWLWQEFQGLKDYPFYGRCYVMGVEPCSTFSEEGLLDSIEKGVAMRIEPAQSKCFSLKLTVFEGRRNNTGHRDCGD